ncbi:hypothetical protein DYBT9275_04756 [Dyadobacter sp. CECT 9275]|uniref:Four helix bundle protein n=1 Tax=Dyadobacter helix TaxID=2822344 RepID=A0A916NDF8_9BACT|nr:four helix bundle protein [Dyadobacter sp. CECT 9275]CAG5010560.1 hypothetical protein DYBT9275_04756 [Dyadobacter sp. CECT 9275]
MASHDFRDLMAYKFGFELAMSIFEITKNFPAAERFSLTDQIRRSSRSVCACIGEAYRKRRYPAHFVSKVSDADMENCETQVWLEFSFACKYITAELYENLNSQSQTIGRLLSFMINNPDKFSNLKHG